MQTNIFYDKPHTNALCPSTVSTPYLTSITCTSLNPKKVIHFKSQSLSIHHCIYFLLFEPDRPEGMYSSLTLFYFLPLPFTNQYVTNGFQNQMLTFSHEKGLFLFLEKDREQKDRGRKIYIHTHTYILYTYLLITRVTQIKGKYLAFIKIQAVSVVHL